VTAEHEDFAEALKAVLNAAFELTDHEVLRTVLVAERALVGLHRTSAREEESRQHAGRRCATSSSPGRPS
jgi:hypothetical protein